MEYGVEEYAKSGVLALCRLRPGVDVSLSAYLKVFGGEEREELIRLLHDLWKRNEEGDHAFVEQHVVCGQVSIDQVLTGRL